MSPIARGEREYMPAGRRRHRVTVENPGTPAPDGHGDYTIPPVVSPIPWDVAIDLLDAGSQEATAADTTTAHVSHLVTGPYRADVTTRSAFTFNGRRLNCTAVRNMGERNITLRCTCSEVEAVTP